jgi:bifunctional non-homologous end joining protein LigD
MGRGAAELGHYARAVAAPRDKRLAVRTEDHPLSYLEFEGTIPEGNYGAGTVMLWDLGHWQPDAPVKAGLRKGHLRFTLHGQRLTGAWHLIRMKGRKAADAGRENWLLVKDEDEAAGRRDPVARYLRSVVTRRTMREIAAQAAPAPPPHVGKLPRFRPVQLATLESRMPTGEGWWHELKFDGYRALVALGQGGPRIYTRNGHDWTDRFASLAGGFDTLDCRSALIDGEIVSGAGVHGFSALQDAIKAGGPFTFHAFDLLERDGADLAAEPLGTRRRGARARLRAGAAPRSGRTVAADRGGRNGKLPGHLRGRRRRADRQAPRCPLSRRSRHRLAEGQVSAARGIRHPRLAAEPKSRPTLCLASLGNA